MKLRQLFALLLAAVLVCCLTACGNSSEAESTESIDETASSAEEIANAVGEEISRDSSTKKIKVGFSNVNLTDEFFANMDTAMNETFTSMGMEYSVLSAESNSVTQVENIENFITMGMDYIVLFVVNAPTVTDVLVKARESGAFVIVIGTILENSDAYDICINVDQAQAGHNAAVMASDWIDKTFPDAADGEIEVALLGSSETADAVARSEGLADIEELNSKVTIVETYTLAAGEDGNTKGQEFTEMLFMEYPELDCIITYGTNLGAAANEVALRQTVIDFEKFAVFTVDTDEYILKNIAASETNSSLIRGTIALGDGTAYTCGQLINGEWMDRVEDGIYRESLNPVTIDNIADYMK